MTIPGRGDLAPRRRHGGYGHRQRRWPRVLLVLLILAALGAGGYYGWHHWRNKDTATAALAPCPTPTAAPSSSPPPRVAARILNGSLKAGLAKKVAKGLQQRFGVVVGKVGNAARFTRGVSVVRYPPRLAASARALAGYVVPRARLRADTHLRKVELDIGTRFRSVAPKPLATKTLPSTSPVPCASP